LFNVAAAVSLMLCPVAAVLWVRGYFATDAFGMRVGAGHLIGVISDTGSLAFSWQDRPPEELFVWNSRRPPGHLQTTAPLGFTWRRSQHTLMLYVPNWFVMIPAALAIVVLLRRAWTRVGPGCCPNCGYDLRATLDRCPECGRVPGRVPPSTAAGAA
jgi:hypothetical protein